MKIQSNFSKVGITAGFLWAIIFAVRYLAIYPDYSQAIVFVGLGCILMAFSWLYDTQLRIRYTVDAMEEHMEDYLKKKG